MCAKSVPLDSEACDSWLLSKDIAADTLKNWLGWWVCVHLIVVVLVVDIVANTNKLAVIVGAGQEDDSDTKNFGIWNAAGVWSLGLKDKLVDTDWDWTDQKRVQLLVVLSRLGGTDIGELPLKIYTNIC